MQRRKKAIIDVDDIFARSIPEPNTGCWLWLGPVGHNNYGRGRRQGFPRKEFAHRISWMPNIALDGPKS